MEHLNQEQIVSYRARSLDAAEVLRLSDHLAQCDDCRTRVAVDADPAAAAKSLIRTVTLETGTFTHLTYDQIAAYVDGQMNHGDAARVEAHARECRDCARDLREIQALKAEMEAGESRTARPNWLAGFWRAIQGWRGAGAFAAVAAGLVVAALVFHAPKPSPRAKVGPPKQAGHGEAPPVVQGTQAVIRDGNRAITVSAEGRVAGLDGLPDRLRGAVEQALVTQRVSAPAAIGELATKRSVLLGPSTATMRVDLLQPIGVVVETARPVFRWKPLADAEYQVSVYDSGFERAGGSGWIRETEWHPSIELRRGIRYFWQLTVRRAGGEFTAPEPPEPEARFRILDAATEADLVRLRSAWSDSHLVMGVAYAQAGLLSEAKQELQEVAAQNPDDVRVAALLASVNRPAVSSDRRRSK